MLDYKQRLDSIMLQLQSIIDEEYEDNDYKYVRNIFYVYSIINRF